MTWTCPDCDARIEDLEVIPATHDAPAAWTEAAEAAIEAHRCVGYCEECLSRVETPHSHPACDECARCGERVELLHSRGEGWVCELCFVEQSRGDVESARKGRTP